MAGAALVLATALGACRPPPESREAAEPPVPGAESAVAMAVIEGEGELAPFLIDRYEVTNAQFEAFLRASGHPWPQGDPRTWDLPRRRLRKRDRREHPVVRVTLADARAFAAWAGKRLPTFREWVRAANRRGRAEYPWGTRSPEQYYTNSLSSHLFCSAPVGAFPSGRSESGVFDLVGNVWEWTDTIPDLWSEDVAPARRSVHVYTWMPRLIPALDTGLSRGRIVLDQADPVWFPRLLPGLDGRPEILRKPSSRVPVPYTGSGRLVVGGSFRNRVVPNFTASDLQGDLRFEELERGICSIQLLAPAEWRDDLGFRCVRDIGPAEVKAFLRALTGAPPRKRDRLAEALTRMGRALVLPFLDRMETAGDPDLQERIRKIREELGT